MNSLNKRLIGILVSVIILLLFAMYNTEAAKVTVFKTFETTVTKLTFTALVIGFLAGFLFIFPTIRSKNKKIDELNKFISDFRNKERDKAEQDIKDEAEKGE